MESYQDTTIYENYFNLLDAKSNAWRLRWRLKKTN